MRLGLDSRRNARDSDAAPQICNEGRMRFKAVIIYDPACGKAIRRHELFADGVADSLLCNVKEIPKNAWNSNGMVWNRAFFRSQCRSSVPGSGGSEWMAIFNSASSALLC